LTANPSFALRLLAVLAVLAGTAHVLRCQRLFNIWYMICIEHIRSVICRGYQYITYITLVHGLTLYWRRLLNLSNTPRIQNTDQVFTPKDACSICCYHPNITGDSVNISFQKPLYQNRPPRIVTENNLKQHSSIIVT
jgi:hypothetical protein